MCSDEWQQKVWDYIRVLPSKIGGVSPQVLQENPWLKVFMDLSTTGERGVFYKGAMQIMPQIKELEESILGMVLFGDKSPREACSTVQKKVEELVCEQGYLG